MPLMGLSLNCGSISDHGEENKKKSVCYCLFCPGIVLILAGQCVSATQMIVEELFLKKKNFHPLQVS